ncbi:MAG: XisI protein [Rivularia sp. (in: cyanobacteria)]
MEKLTKYRQLVQQILLEHGKHKSAYGDIEVQTIFDTQRDHYQIVYVGWKGDNWTHSCIIHIDIKGEKIWLQWNGTEDDIAADLVDLGVPKEDIVLGFQSPFMRKFTEYAVS